MTRKLLVLIILINLFIKTHCEKATIHNVNLYLNGIRKCEFHLKHERHIDPKKLSLTWYYQYDEYITYTLDEASHFLNKNHEFWNNPQMNIYVSGFGFSSSTPDSLLIADVFLNAGHPVMLFDYSEYSSIDIEYGVVATNLYNIGEHFAKFLVDMVKCGVPVKNIYLMGLSLGGQLVGYIARSFYMQYGKKLHRVTALEPAGPCFDIAEAEENIKKDDAKFVVIYNLNRGQLGTNQSLGHVNIFGNNGGPLQITCEKEVLMSFVDSFSMHCAHAVASLALWKHLFESPHLVPRATQCRSVDEAIKGKCKGREIDVGHNISKKARGVYTLNSEFDMFELIESTAAVELLSLVL